ncbi:serine hydrolase domain-containing protein [Fodinicola acaciae]|uniref:serine hydrolase domain-containing protein n=1 Tax=Fodinicola acaciae TaxID=2681555 RepID=UPI0013D135A4|nr:serine hydrolase domain-containing protein [Fodinicola acaciae]
MTITEGLVHGQVAAGFEPVAEAFADNLTERGEIGAAFAAVHDGRVVVDIWGGLADPATGRGWQEDTLQLVYSGTKGLVAAAMLILVERGLLDLRAPVATYWPEFAAHGKGAVTVAQVMSHQARLPGIRRPVTAADTLDPVRMAALLADQPQETDPRAVLTYHPLTYGWLAGELVRRVDGRTVGRFVREEIAEPLAMQTWIGLPAELEPRVSTIVYAPSWRRMWSRLPADDELFLRAWSNPPLWPDGPVAYNGRAFHAAEVPGAGAISTARSLARFYGALALGGRIDGVRIMAPETVELGQRPIVDSMDQVLFAPFSRGVGFQLQNESMNLGPAKVAFGHDGAGGSVHAAWPELRTGFSYAMNELRSSLAFDPRPKALLDALHSVVG